jgi:hypothetical protein
MILNAPEALGAATVNRKVFFGYEGTEHSGLRPRSSPIRPVKIAFPNHRMMMPHKAREISIPEGAPLGRQKATTDERPEPKMSAPTVRPKQVINTILFTEAQGESSSKAESIRKQAQQARNPEALPDLLSERPDNTVSKPTV